ncbi:MAG: hypothetical protein GW917_01080 [Bdellovibrionales bacterium]|nr:hypothetical protein [Bdellovibrionales bacterium]
MNFSNLKPLIWWSGIGFGMALSLSSCISVHLGPPPVTSAEKVNYLPPPSPFKETPSTTADRTWINEKNNNTITYLSECGNLSGISLSEAAKVSFQSQELKLISQESANISGYTGLVSRGVHFQDNKAVEVELVNFKTEDCLFSLAYVANKDRFEENYDQFINFRKTFKAP